MKASLLLSSLFGLQALAFPTLGSVSSKLKDISDEDLHKITELADKVSVDIKKRQLGLDLLPVVGFDPVAQKVDTTGQHEYRKPGKNDIRGSCPGLNMMANHGYISRDGVDSVVNIIMASQKMFGMGHDLATYLTTYAALVAGDLVSVSIGGPPPSGGLLGGLTSLASDLRLLGKPQGLSRSHNRFENDMSPTREDLYLGNHDVDSVNIRQFKELTAMELGPRGYDLGVMTKFRGERYKWTIANNPYFFAGPLTHYALNTGTYVFTYRLMANHSAEYPDGYLDLETLMSMEGVKRDANGEFVFEWGSERIPENYYKRAIGDDFSIPAFAKDALYQLQQLPYMAVAGGNMGKVNTFTGLDIANLTGGIFNAQNIFEGNNAMCLAFTASMQVTPDLLRGLVGNILLAVQSLTKVLDPIFEQLGCPQQAKFDSTAYGAALGQYPGAKGGAI